MEKPCKNLNRNHRHSGTPQSVSLNIQIRIPHQALVHFPGALPALPDGFHHKGLPGVHRLYKHKVKDGDICIFFLPLKVLGIIFELIHKFFLYIQKDF